MLCYRYLVQSTSEDEKMVFTTTKALVDYLNDRIGMRGVYTADMIQNYFKPRKTRKNINPLLANLYHLTRDRATTSSSKPISSI